MNLSVDEKIQLSHHEQCIQQGVKASLDMARALYAIRQDKLYRGVYETFEDYCDRRWGFSVEYGRLLLRFAEKVSTLEQTPTTVGVLPSRERQTRSLTGTPNQQAEAWEAAVTIAEGQQPTSSQVSRAVTAVKSKPASFIQPGQSVNVLAEESPFYGQQVRVADCQGAIVRAETQHNGVQPFLRNELEPQPIAAQPRTVATPTPNPLETQQIHNQVLTRRCELLESKLREAIALLQSIDDPAVAEWIAAIDLML